MWLYFRQKEYELVKQRYLDGGVDVLIGQLEHSLGVASHNFGRCLQVMKSFRDTDAQFDLKMLSDGFLPLDSSKFAQHANHRIGSLLGSQIVWDVFQGALAYAANSNAQFTNEVPEAMRLKRTTDWITKSEKEMADAMVEDLRLLHEEGFKYTKLIAELHFLGRLLETEKLSIAAVSSFSKRPEVKQLLTRLTEAFPDAPSAA